MPKAPRQIPAIDLNKMNSLIEASIKEFSASPGRDKAIAEVITLLTRLNTLNAESPIRKINNSYILTKAQDSILKKLVEKRHFFTDDDSQPIPANSLMHEAGLNLVSKDNVKRCKLLLSFIFKKGIVINTLNNAVYRYNSVDDEKNIEQCALAQKYHKQGGALIKRGSPTDIEKGVRNWAKAVELNHSVMARIKSQDEEQSVFAEEYYQQGLTLIKQNSPTDIEKGVDKLQQAAELNHIKATGIIGRAMLTGKLYISNRFICNGYPKISQAGIKLVTRVVDILKNKYLANCLAEHYIKLRQFDQLHWFVKAWQYGSKGRALSILEKLYAEGVTRSTGEVALQPRSPLVKKYIDQIKQGQNQLDAKNELGKPSSQALFSASALTTGAQPPGRARHASHAFFTEGQEGMGYLAAALKLEEDSKPSP